MLDLKFSLKCNYFAARTKINSSAGCGMRTENVNSMRLSRYKWIKSDHSDHKKMLHLSPSFVTRESFTQKIIYLQPFNLFLQNN